MNKKKILSLVVVVLLCLVLAWEVSIIVDQQIQKKLSHEYPVMDIVTTGLWNCTAEIRTDSGVTTEEFQGGLQSPLYLLAGLPLKATTKAFNAEDWLYRFTFHYYTLGEDNSVTTYDVVCIIGPENMQLDGVTYELSGSDWELILPQFEVYLEQARSDFFTDFE